MAQITAKLVKDLREKTGAGMMDCKKALNETDGDIDAAIDWLRTKGLSMAAKKSDRVASEGLVVVATSGTVGVAIEINAETDFVSRNEQFQKFSNDVAELALKGDGTVDSLNAMDYPETGRTVAEELTHLIATIGENMTIRRMSKISVEKGVVASYVHNSITPTSGKIGVLVALEGEGDADKLMAEGRQIAMHVAATNPEALTIDNLDADFVEREKEVQRTKARESGKPEEIIEKMIVGRMSKFYKEVVLSEQTYVIDGERKVSKVAKDLGVELKDYVRLELGAGIEKKEDDFAAEVAAMAS